MLGPSCGLITGHLGVAVATKTGEMPEAEEAAARDAGRQRMGSRRFYLPEGSGLPAVLTALGFLIDWITPLGVADGFFYTIAILSCLWIPSAGAAWIAAALITPLFLLGYYISPPSDSSEAITVANRLLSLAVMWVSAGLVDWRVNARLAIDRAARQLQLHDRRKDEFLATLAHELRNPLAPLRNAVALLQHPGASEEMRSSAIGVMDRQVQTMAQLVDDLLDISRISSGKLLLQKQRVELRTVIGQALEVAGPAIAEHGHQLLFDPALTPRIGIEADPLRLSQAIANLLTNAAKYTPRGGRIELKSELQPGVVRIMVKDSGIGLDAESRAKVFGVFYQVQSASDSPQGGLGIGLALVKAFVELHGGSVEVRSDGVGLGSEFIVTLPCTQSGGDALPAATDGPARAVSPLKVLLIDDNRDAASTLAALLRLDGHTVHLASNGRDGLEAVSQLDPDVVITDIGLPALSGYELARRIRESYGSKPVRLIALTGFGQEEDRRRAYAAGFDAHLTKPVEPKLLQELLASTARHE